MSPNLDRDLRQPIVNHMIEILIVVFVVGFIVYYLIRHPLRSMKRIGQGVGLFALGILGLCAVLMVLVAVQMMLTS